jgi:hypothetical protein
MFFVYSSHSLSFFPSFFFSRSRDRPRTIIIDVKFWMYCLKS